MVALKISLVHCRSRHQSQDFRWDKTPTNSVEAHFHCPYRLQVFVRAAWIPDFSTWATDVNQVKLSIYTWPLFPVFLSSFYSLTISPTPRSFEVKPPSIRAHHHGYCWNQWRRFLPGSPQRNCQWALSSSSANPISNGLPLVWWMWGRSTWRKWCFLRRMYLVMSLIPSDYWCV